MEEKPNCVKCKHYHMTWDMNSPKGCRAYQIKTSALPNQIVKQASGEDCMKYEPKKKKGQGLWDENLW